MNTQMMTLPVNTVPKRYDIIVVGGGTAGVMAAVAAAESGKDVMILERGYQLGGSSTLAQVTPWMTTRLDNSENSYLARRLNRMLDERGYVAAPWIGATKTIFSPVTMTVVLEDMCENAGVDLLYGATFVDVCREGDRLTAVLAQTLDGLCRFETDFVIDATGDAQVAFMAGCPVETGDPENDHINQHMSLRFAIGGVDMPAVNKALFDMGMSDADPDAKTVYMASEWKGEDSPLKALFQKALDNGDLEYADGVYFQVFSSAACGDNVIYCNCPEAPRCQHTTDPFEVTQGVVDCRRSAVRLHNFLKKYVHGFENSVIISFAQLPGVRESRRIVGERVLTMEDYNARAKFPDGIAQSAYPVDVHGTSLVHPNTFKKGEFFEVPFSTLIAKNVDNLLVAGRCSSATFWAQSATRIQLVCYALGEAAGIGASMALDLSCAAKSVDGAAVRAEMIARGGLFVTA